MRTAFIEKLTELAQDNEKIFLVVADLGYSVVENFANKFPDRFLNVGIAEQNMAGIASGLALEGYSVFVYSIGNFPTLRCMEQIRYDICYHNLDVNIIAVGGGYAYGSLGPSHHATEELGMLRTIPNLTICAPGDPEEAKMITKFITGIKGPCYVRLGKSGEPIVHTNLENIKLISGQILKVLEDNTKSNAIFTTGSMLKYAKDYIINNKINSSLYSFPFVKPINIEQLQPLFATYKNIITLEEHQKDGGFGSAILELFNDYRNENFSQKNIPKIQRIAINNQFYSISGTQEFIRSFAGLELTENLFYN